MCEFFPLMWSTCLVCLLLFLILRQNNHSNYHANAHFERPGGVRKEVWPQRQDGLTLLGSSYLSSEMLVNILVCDCTGVNVRE